MSYKTIVRIPVILNLIRSCSTASKSEIFVGASASVEKTITAEDVRLFSQLSGDWNAVHHAEENAVVHGSLLNGFVSGVIGTKLPGSGTLLLKQTLRFPNACYVGDTVIVTVTLTHIRRIISCNFTVISKSRNNVVMEGDAKLLLKDL